MEGCRDVPWSKGTTGRKYKITRSQQRFKEILRQWPLFRTRLGCKKDVFLDPLFPLCQGKILSWGCPYFLAWMFFKGTVRVENRTSRNWNEGIGNRRNKIFEKYCKSLIPFLLHKYSSTESWCKRDISRKIKIVWIPFMIYFVFLSFVVSRLPFYIKTKEGIKRAVRISSMLSRGSTHWLKLAFPKYYRPRNTRLLTAPRLWHSLYLDTIV